MCVRKHIVRLKSVVLALPLSVALGGCGLFGASDTSAIETTIPYDGPPARLVSIAGSHAVVFTAPTGGWSVAFDRTDAAHRRTHAFVTLTRPDPSLGTTQALVEHTVGTGIRDDEPIAVFARIVPHDQPDAASPYREAVSSQGTAAGQTHGER